MSLFVAALFFVLTPGVFLTLPPKGSVYVVAAVHGVVFALVYHLTHKIVWNALYGKRLEGFVQMPGDIPGAMRTQMKRS